MTSQFQTIGNGTFWLGDCFDVMAQAPDACVDMILTDPPYGMKFNSNYRKEKHKKIENDDNLNWLPEFARQCYRLAKDNTAHYVFCSFHFIDLFKYEFEQYFTVKNILVWEKNNTSMGDLKGDFAPKVEFVLFLHKGKAKIRGKRDPNIFKFARTGNKLHPTQKPTDMFVYLIEKFSDKNDLVFDPFGGSGTTAIAAEVTERRWVVCELDEQYANQSVERIKEHLKKEKANG